MKSEYAWVKGEKSKERMANVGFEPTPFQTSALNWRLRPLGQLTIENLITYISYTNLHTPLPTQNATKQNQNYTNTRTNISSIQRTQTKCTFTQNHTITYAQTRRLTTPIPCILSSSTPNLSHMFTLSFCHVRCFFLFFFSIWFSFLSRVHVLFIWSFGHILVGSVSVRQRKWSPFFFFFFFFGLLLTSFFFFLHHLSRWPLTLSFFFFVLLLHGLIF